jgi:hypothetical protein
VETLEAREVPAAMVWQNYSGDGDFNNPANWRDGDTLDPAGRIPTSGDDVIFRRGLGSVTDCNDFNGPATGAYNSVSIINDYTGTVTLASGFTTGTLVMEYGAISQPTSGTDITVTSHFNWTGGTLNSSDNIANLNLNGATFLVAGLGSQINVAAGGSLTFKSGQLSSDLPLKNDGGTVTIMPDTFAHFRGAVAGYVDNWSCVQASGITRLYMGNTTVNARLNAEEGMLMSGGTLSVMTTHNGVALDGAATIVLGGLNDKTLRISGGEIIYRDGDAAYYDYGELKIVGNVDWQGGTYRPYVQYDTDTEGWADLWTVAGTPGTTFNIGGTAAVDAKAVDGEGNIVDPQANKRWLFLKAGSITNAGGTPTFGAGWGFEPSNDNPVTKWYLKAV